MEKKKTATGAKARQRDDKEDRSIVYRDWRRETVSKGQKRSTCYTSDIDQVEYIIVKGEVIPVALLELTRYDFDEYDRPAPAWTKYRNAIIDRYFRRDAQGRFIQKMAELLQIPAYIVLFRNDMESIWTFDVVDRAATWQHKTPEEYEEWLCKLKTEATQKAKEKIDE